MDQLIRDMRDAAKMTLALPDEAVGGVAAQLAFMAERAADELEKWRWIPVEERLPKKNGHYLVVLRRYGFVDDIKLNDKNVKILRFHDGQWRLPVHIPEWINETLTQEVTHWMELPGLPEDDDT